MAWGRAPESPGLVVIVDYNLGRKRIMTTILVTETTLDYVECYLPKFDKVEFGLFQKARDKAKVIQKGYKAICPSNTWATFKSELEVWGFQFQQEVKFSSERDQTQENCLFQQKQSQARAAEKAQIPWQYTLGALEAAQDRVNIFSSLLKLPIGHRLPSGKVISGADRSNWAQRIHDTEKFVCQGQIWRSERGLKMSGVHY